MEVLVCKLEKVKKKKKGGQNYGRKMKGKVRKRMETEKK